MRDANIHREAYRYDADDDREIDHSGVLWAVLLSTLFWVCVGYAIWSRL